MDPEKFTDNIKNQSKWFNSQSGTTKLLIKTTHKHNNIIMKRNKEKWCKNNDDKKIKISNNDKLVNDSSFLVTAPENRKSYFGKAISFSNDNDKNVSSNNSESYMEPNFSNEILSMSIRFFNDQPDSLECNNYPKSSLNLFRFSSINEQKMMQQEKPVNYIKLSTHKNAPSAHLIVSIFPKDGVSFN
uniref:Uncharacterized protein n=1 Tax=Parastrongyloides trichosuri TaxID=131310 RepID=A0A0N4ZC54_PARTI